MQDTRNVSSPTQGTMTDRQSHMYTIYYWYRASSMLGCSKWSGHVWGAIEFKREARTRGGKRERLLPKHGSTVDPALQRTTAASKGTCTTVPNKGTLKLLSFLLHTQIYRPGRTTGG